MRFVFELDSPLCLEQAMVGAKAARLSQMVSMGFPVPDAFVLNINAFEHFCMFNGISLKNPHSINELPNLILEGAFPEELHKAIEDHLNRSKADLFAVRSSSVTEDGHEFSMAGQYQTFLNSTKDEIFYNIKACWSGAFNDAVKAYTKSRQLKINYNIGVIIQQQIIPEYSGVLFTLDPRSRTTDYFVIEWVKGLGDKLVSGQVTPETLYVHRNSLQIDDTASTKLKPFLNSLVGYAQKAEKEFDFPVDMEWCADQNLHLLQARPVTALIKPNSIIWTNVNMAENFPQPLPPFTWSIVDKFYTAYMTSILKLFGWKITKISKFKKIIHNLTGIQGGRIYYNLSNWYEILYFFPIGKYLKPFLDNYIGQKVPLSFFPKTDEEVFKKEWQRPLKHIQFWLKLIYIHFTSNKHLDTFENQFHRHRKKWRKSPYHEQSLSGLINGIDKIFTEFIDKYYYSQGIADIAVLIFPGILTRLIKKWFPEYKDSADKAIVQLFQDINVKSTEPAKIISTIANHVRSDDTLQQFLVSKNYELLEQGLKDETKLLLNKFMFYFGARCYNECMIVSPTFEERHDLFWNLVEKYQSASELRIKANTRREFQNQNAIKKNIESRLPFLKRMIFSIVLKKSRHAIGLREQGRLIRSLIFGEIRLIILEIGKQLKKIGHLKDTEDVFNLQLHEIEQIANGKFQFPETIPELIQQRSNALKKCFDNSPPELFLSEPGIFYKSHKTHYLENNGKTLKGNGVSGGIVTGIARIILDPVTDNRLEPGEILVTRSTDPGWTPLFIIAGGMVLERGGLLSHGAIVSREFSIPAVVGVENATRRIKDGNSIKIDGMTGIIEIIEN